jgi:hypothetical protein
MPTHAWKLGKTAFPGPTRKLRIEIFVYQRYVTLYQHG